MSIAAMLELTLAIIKPHVVKNFCSVNEIRDMILKSNFKIVRAKRSCLDIEKAENFYKEHRSKFFFHRLVTFMTSGPCDTYILAKENAIRDWRQLLGPTKVFQAQYTHPDSIRGKLGLSDTRNAAHGSDSLETAVKEIKFFFPTFDINEWYKNEEPYFRRGRVKFVQKDFLHLPEQVYTSNKP